jgi:hypothetical protein
VVVTFVLGAAVTMAWFIVTGLGYVVLGGLMVHRLRASARKDPRFVYRARARWN